MKKKISILVTVIVAAMMITGCSIGELDYDFNLGYDLNDVKYDNVSFNIYHSNTEDHCWEKIASIPCEKKSGHYSDLVMKSKGERITAVLKDNTYTKEDESITYGGTSEDVFSYEVRGFTGKLTGYQSFAVKNKKGEQCMRLYPVQNDGLSSYSETVDLNEPYDTEGRTLDDILITIVMN